MQCQESMDLDGKSTAKMGGPTQAASVWLWLAGQNQPRIRPGIVANEHVQDE
jgi:hypothetical protein